mgnify:CR=1 FL=1
MRSGVFFLLFLWDLLVIAASGILAGIYLSQGRLLSAATEGVALLLGTITVVCLVVWKKT